MRHGFQAAEEMIRATAMPLVTGVMRKSFSINMSILVKYVTAEGN
jgi:hypothetical protein